MAPSVPPPETIQFIKQVLAAGRYGAAEVPLAIASIHRAVTALAGLPSRDAAPALVTPTRRPTPPSVVPVDDPAEPVALNVAATPSFGEASAPVTIVPPRRRRGRPPKLPIMTLDPFEAPIPAEPDPEPVAEPAPVSRLVRKTDVSTSATDSDTAISFIPRSTAGVIKGVVKWFDPRTGRGALRLTGVSGDVPLDPELMEQSGIKRLYKDQEIEATLVPGNHRAQVQSLALPARTQDAARLSAGAVIGGPRRQPRAVQVEIKRDGRSRTAARAEAEQVLGGSGRIKIGRRTPTE